LIVCGLIFAFPACFQLLEEFRRRALAGRKRRPWDGPDGADYDHWFYHNTHTVDPKAQQAQEGVFGEYTFEGLEDMTKYEEPVVTAFIESRKRTFSFNLTS
jgi:hypothetical protein